MSRDVKEAKISDPDGIPPISIPRPILASELTEDIHLEEFYIGILKEKRTISKAIQLISTASPGFGHLKRCNGSRLILATVNDNNSLEEFKSSLSSKGFELSLLEDEFQVLKLPSKPVRTKIQAEKFSKIWPLNFHPDPTIESIINGDIFKREQLYRIESLMRSTIDAAKIEAIGNSECNGSALIVDPESGQTLALASSKIDENPLWHAAMLAIDLVAKIQGGGAWDLINNYQNTDSSSDKFKRKFNGGIPLRYPKSLIGVNLPKSEPLIEEKLQKFMKKNKEPDDIFVGEKDKTGPYLCTNFWVFLIQEPCALCAMALLHSRASRIFYGIKKKDSGFLESKARLHTTPGLNHRYQVWAGILENQCQTVCEEIKTRELKLG